LPRGGKRAADDYSPYKHPDGRELKLLKSSSNEKGGGYYQIAFGHGKFYVKLKLDGVRGSRKQKLFGKSNTAREAAIVAAEYRDAPWELPDAPPRQPRGSQLVTQRQLQQQRDARLKALMQEAHSLLGISEEMTKEEEAAETAAAAEFMAWKEARHSQSQPVATMVTFMCLLILACDTLSL
jgi:hypothetical protein